jgi:hypothetical protein
MARELSASQRRALQELVAEGVLSVDQADAVRARLESAAGRQDRPAVSRGWLVETAVYLGGALTFAGAALLVGLSWDELSRAGQILVLAAVTVLLVVAGVVIAGGPRELHAMAGVPSTVRRRVVSVLFALSAGTAALAAGVAVDTHEVLIGGATGLVLAAVAYLVLPSLPVLLAAAALSVVTGIAVGDDLLGDTPLRTGLTLIAIGAGWAVLGLAGVLAHRTAAAVAGGVIGLFGAQLVLGDSAAAGWAYLLTLLVAIGCLATYAIDRGVVLLALGVIGITLAVAEAVADWTNGAAGGAAAVLTAGAVLLVGSGLALRLHRRQNV